MRSATSPSERAACVVMMLDEEKEYAVTLRGCVVRGLLLDRQSASDSKATKVRLQRPQNRKC